MFVIRMLLPVSDDKAGTYFKNKDDAEDFLRRARYLKLGNEGDLKDVWVQKPTRGASLWPTIVFIEEEK